LIFTDLFRTLYGMPNDAKSSRLDLRLTEEERERYQQAAERDSRTLSNWIRDRLNKAAAAELAEEGAKGKSKRPSP
jgi:uncharacterized protein (DUF1778 family)